MKTAFPRSLNSGRNFEDYDKPETFSADFYEGGQNYINLKAV